MTRILHVLTSPRAEGTPRLVLDWLGTAGHEQGVAFLTGEPPDLLDEFRRAANWIRLGRALPRGPRKFPAIVRAARGWVGEFRPDVVIAWPTGFSHWIFLGARAAGGGARLLAHGGNPPGTGWVDRQVMTCLCLWTTALCDGQLVACSRYVQERFQAVPLVPRHRVAFAYNSLRAGTVADRAAAARARRKPGGRFRAIMVATLETHKDHATLLRALAAALAGGADLELALVGAGRLADALRTQADALGLGARVEFLGARRDVPELLGQSDLFVFSTTAQEGWGVAVLEALAAGLPVVASDVPALREALADGRWGRLVSAGDPGALARALADAARTGPETAPVRAARQAYAGSFTPQRMIDAYLAIAGDSPSAAVASSPAVLAL